MENGKEQEVLSIEDQTEVTGATRMKQLREACKSKKGGRPLWLAELSDRQLAEVYHRLKIGQPPNHIVNIAQRDWGVRRNSTARSLWRSVVAFRDRVLADLQQLRGEGGKSVLKRKGKRIYERLDAMGSKRWLINVQLERVELQYAREKQMGMPLKATDRMVRVAGELLDSYIGRAIELGVLDSKPSEFNLNIKHRFDGLVANTIQGGGVAMIQATNDFLDMAEKKALTLALDDEGHYTLEPPEEEEEEEAEDDANVDES